MAMKMMMMMTMRRRRRERRVTGEDTHKNCKNKQN